MSVLAISAFSFIHDLTHGFWQMPLEEQSRHLTAISISGPGKFQWTLGSMGLQGCQALFQRLGELAMAGMINIIV
jgi:hypothetical protein